MSLRDSGALYVQGISRMRIRALNDDLSTPAYNNVIGGAGPFDFTSFSADYTTIPIMLKTNSGAVVSETFDITAAIDKAAVTVDELVTALTAASITGWTVSKDSTTGRIKFVSGTTGAYVQVYGAGARAMKIGQGFGLKALKSDTVQTITFTPTVEEDATYEIVDAHNKKTGIIISGYKKGLTGVITDTASDDFEIMEIIEAGTISTDGKKYTDPNSTAKKPMFEVEVYNPIYTKGLQDEDQIAKWEHTHVLMAKGNVGDTSKSIEFGTTVFNITAVNYKPRITGAEEGGAKSIELVDLEDWTPEGFDLI
jgi:hypothetical protein